VSRDWIERIGRREVGEGGERGVELELGEEGEKSAWEWMRDTETEGNKRVRRDRMK
jgi:hypothetical protein